MALDQFALLELLDVMRSADGGELMRRLLGTIVQLLVDAEATAFVGAERHPHAAPPAKDQDASASRNRNPARGNVQRLAKLLDNGALRVHIQPQYPLGEGRAAPTTRHTRGNCSCGCPFANSAAISRRPGPGGFVRLPTWLSCR
jgi:hypothetical protein